ncbi:lipid phosphate phosphatase epsilon [Salix suchowensis]|nr:lipid phosphate phosphatase epsilon [Salix suchowensis]
MMSVPAILHKPIFKSLPFVLLSLVKRNPFRSFRFQLQNLIFLVQRIKLWLFQQEAVIDGPNEFQSGLLADGLEATLNRLSKWLVAVLFGTVILWRHDAEAMWAVMGSIVNSILSVILKRIFNQERPDSTLRSDPGMPSSHGQSIFFTVVFAILSVVEWLGANEFALILSAFILVFGTYLVSIIPRII